MEHLSAVIITYNEERNIGRCIDSLRAVADEIIVLDSFSTDNTIRIAKEKGAKVYQQKFAGYVKQKNKALEYTNYNYVLCLDADEELNEELKESVLKAKQGFMFQAYSMSRCAFYLGKFIKHGTWYPERKIRLFDKRYLNWSGLHVHDRVVAPERMAVYPLKGDILHYICQTKEEHKQRSDNFSYLSALAMYEKGKKPNLVKLLASPAWCFIHDLFIRRGILNGWRGFSIALEQSRYHFLKYKKLRELYKNPPAVAIKQGSLNIQTTTNADRLPRDVAAEI